MMEKRKAFTLIELLVVIAIIALLMSMLMPGLAKVQQKAREVKCLSNLKQWCVIISMYTGKNDGYFQPGFVSYDQTKGGRQTKPEDEWPTAWKPYYKDNNDLRLCPMAVKPHKNKDGSLTQAKDPFMSWGWISSDRGDYWAGELTDGSYGVNGWLQNPPPGTSSEPRLPPEWHYRTTNVKGAGKIPLFFGCNRVDAWPLNTDRPPLYNGEPYISGGGTGGGDIRRVCLDRHGGYVGMSFLDFSVRKVGLKELWTFKWHKKYDITAGPEGIYDWENWPEWMDIYRDYAVNPPEW